MTILLRAPFHALQRDVARAMFTPSAADQARIGPSKEFLKRRAVGEEIARYLGPMIRRPEGSTAGQFGAPVI